MRYLIDLMKNSFGKNFCNFNGTSSRKDFWSLMMIMIVINISITIIISVVEETNNSLAAIILIISYVISLLFICPMISISVRRLHDVGKSGWFYLLGMIPFVNFYVLYLYCCKSSDTPYVADDEEDEVQIVDEEDEDVYVK